MYFRNMRAAAQAAHVRLGQGGDLLPDPRLWLALRRAGSCLHKLPGGRRSHGDLGAAQLVAVGAEGAVGEVRVVVLYVFRQHGIEVTTSEDEYPVEALGVGA